MTETRFSSVFTITFLSHNLQVIAFGCGEKQFQYFAARWIAIAL